ncbi:MAG TPA: hypothetical protein VF006_03530 [Longimicrobium sp.]
MRKLKLHAEDLTVDSFETAAPDHLLGTVRAAQDVAEPVEPGDDVALPWTWWTCQTGCGQNTCGGSCGVTCSTCNDPTCNSCYATGCWTGNSPQCCA